MWNILLPIIASAAAGLFGSRGGGKEPQTFNYMPGMEQFWQQFQQRLKTPPPKWGGIQPGQTGLPPEILNFLSSSPFPMWEKMGLPFLTGQQGMAMQKYGMGRQSQQELFRSLAGIGSAIAYFLTMQDKNKPDVENLKGMDLLGGYYPYMKG